MMSPKETELLGATALLGGGISLPLQTLLGTVRITMRIPSTEDLLRISRMYLKMGVTAEELNGYTFEQKARFMVIHGREVRRYMHPVALQEAWMRILSPLTLGAFGNITASAEAVNQMAPLTMGQ